MTKNWKPRNLSWWLWVVAEVIGILVHGYGMFSLWHVPGNTLYDITIGIVLAFILMFLGALFAQQSRLRRQMVEQGN